MIIDTAGRSQFDNALMDELKAITKRVPPVETLLVVDSMIGQEALHVAEGFRDTVSLTGLDPDQNGRRFARRRGHLHPRVTGVPIKFLGTGEKLDAFEVYDPRAWPRASWAWAI
jgi:signal recognition particle subunit SRP54